MQDCSNCYLIVLLVILGEILAIGNLEPPKNIEKLPPCRTCKVFVESFKKVSITYGNSDCKTLYLKTFYVSKCVIRIQFKVSQSE